jgi:HNH endonuclease
MAELSPRARTLLDLSAKHRAREAKRALFAGIEVGSREAQEPARVLFAGVGGGADSRKARETTQALVAGAGIGAGQADPFGLDGVTQDDLCRMFISRAVNGGVPWPPAPVDVLFLLEAVALFRPFLSLLAEDVYSGRLWGVHINDSLERLADPRRNLIRLQYQMFARPTGETQRSSLPAVADLQADIEAVLEVSRGQLSSRAEDHLAGLCYWLGEWREDVFNFDAFTFWMVKTDFLGVIAAFKRYTPDLEALRSRLRRRVFNCAKKGRAGWKRLAKGHERRSTGPLSYWRLMLESAENLGGFFLEGPDHSPMQRPCRSAIVRRIACGWEKGDGLLDAVAPTPQPTSDAYYEAKKRRGLIHAPEVISGGFPDAESLRPRIHPWHPEGIAREIVERVRGWTAAALILTDDAGASVNATPFSSLTVDEESEDGEAGGEELPFQRVLAASPGELRTAHGSSFELDFMLERCGVAAAVTMQQLTPEEQRLVRRSGSHDRQSPLSTTERKGAERARKVFRQRYTAVFNRLPRRLGVAPGEIDPDVRAVIIAEECRGQKPDTCSGERSAVDAIREETSPAPRGACWVWWARRPRQGDLRWAWHLVYGEIPKSTKAKKYEVRHACGNRRCVNPDHLTLDPQALTAKATAVKADYETRRAHALAAPPLNKWRSRLTDNVEKLAPMRADYIATLANAPRHANVRGLDKHAEEQGLSAATLARLLIVNGLDDLQSPGDGSKKGRR